MLYILGYIICVAIGIGIAKLYDKKVTVRMLATILVLSLGSWFSLAVGVVTFAIGAVLYLFDRYGNKELF